MNTNTPDAVEATTVISKPEKTVDEQLIDSEKRVQDNRTAFLKKSQEAAEGKILIESLTKQLQEKSTGVSALPQKEQDRLNDLKYSDPDAWLIELTGIDSKAAAELNITLNNIKNEATLQASKHTDEEVINEFVSKNPNITFDNLKEDVPYKLKLKFEKNEISVQEFLTEAGKFFNSTKSYKDPEVLGQDNINTINGSVQASKNATNKQASATYADATF